MGDRAATAKDVPFSEGAVAPHHDYSVDAIAVSLSLYLVLSFRMKLNWRL
jgi:hypothetical protein